MIKRTISLRVEVVNGDGYIIDGIEVDSIAVPMSTVKKLEHLEDVGNYADNKGKFLGVNAQGTAPEFVDLRGEIKATETRLTQRDNSLDAAIKAAAKASTDADTAFKAALDAEVKQNDVDNVDIRAKAQAEVDARVALGTQINDKIDALQKQKDSEVTALKKADVDEAGARKNAVDALTKVVQANKTLSDKDMKTVQDQFVVLNQSITDTGSNMFDAVNTLEGKLTSVDTKVIQTNEAQDKRLGIIETTFATKTFVQDEIKKINITDVKVVAGRKALPSPTTAYGDFYFLTDTKEWVTSDGKVWYDVTSVVPDAVQKQFDDIQARITLEVATLQPTIKPAYEWLKLSGYKGSELQLSSSLNEIIAFNNSIQMTNKGGETFGYIIHKQSVYNDPNQLVNKKYVDDKCAQERTFSTAVDNKNLSKAGDTMTGAFTAAKIKNSIILNDQGSISFQDATNTRFHLTSEGNNFKLKQGNNGENDVLTIDSNGTCSARDYLQNTPQTNLPNASTRKDYVDAQIKAVDDKNFAYYKTALGSAQNLNTLGAMSAAGVYFNPANNTATEANNYPFKEAGSLFVTPSAYGCSQEYTTFNSGRKYARGLNSEWNGKDGPWNAWKEVLTENTPLDSSYLLDETKLFKFRGTCVAKASVNTCTLSGHYHVVDLALDIPEAKFGHMTVSSSGAAGDGVWIQQTLYSHNGKVWIRRNVNGTWGAWAKLYSSADLPTADDIGALAVTGGEVGNLNIKGKLTINGVTAGEKGDTGAQGPKGATGANGAIGPKGDKGDSGIQGPKGDQGIQGVKGDKGDTGATGAKGADGALNAVPANGDSAKFGKFTVAKDCGATPDYHTGQVEINSTSATTSSCIGFHIPANSAHSLQFRPDWLGLSVRAQGGGHGNISAGTFEAKAGVAFNGKAAIGGANDGWLRLNPDNGFTSGIYCGSSLLRTDGGSIQRGQENSHNSAKITFSADTSWGSAGASAFSYYNNNTSGAHWILGSYKIDNILRAGIQVLSNDTGTLRIGTNGGARFVQFENGSVYAQDNVTAYSDRRLKKNIVELDGALDTVLKLRPVQYVMKANEDKLRCGFIAQEVQEVIPEVVLEGCDEDKTLSIDYGNMVAYMAGAIKELKVELDALKRDLGRS